MYVSCYFCIFLSLQETVFKDGKVLFPEHLSLSEIQRGIKSGKYHQVCKSSCACSPCCVRSLFVEVSFHVKSSFYQIEIFKR